MNSKTFGILGIGVGALGLTLGALTFASAADQTSPSPAASTQVHDGRGMGPGSGETALTGADAEKATAAAAARFPGGTVLRVETDAGGTYEAHVRKADGTEVEVKMDEDFTITGVEENGFGHGPMDADGGDATSGA